MLNEAMQLVIDADHEVFEAEKMMAATYAGSKANTETQKLAIKRYESMTGLKASSRRLYDLGIKLYLLKFDKKE